MVPHIENLTHKLAIGNSTKEINIHYILSDIKIKYEPYEHTASKCMHCNHYHNCAVF